MALWKVNGLPTLHLKRKEIFPAPSYKMQKKKSFSPHKEKRIIFFVWELYSLFLYMKFSSPTWKKNHACLAKVPIFTKNSNLTYVPPI